MKQPVIRVGIVGYGNLGKGVELAIRQNGDMQLVGVFTRRQPAAVQIATEGVGVYTIEELDAMQGQIDVLLLCGGSATDLPEMTPALAQKFTVVDSFDNHSKIPQHFAKVDESAKQGKNIAVISVGWDPGLFSLNRVLSQAVLPVGETYTFWGKGVSQGHSDAIRRIQGVADAKQYTVPAEEAVQQVRTGANPSLTTRQKHTRVCFVVAQEGADTEEIRRQIVTMPDYFEPYDTTVHFITEQELREQHGGLPHGGMVIRSGYTGEGQKNSQIVEYKLQLDSNPEFTASVLVAYARAAARLKAEGATGCRTAFDIAPVYLINMSDEEIRKKLL